MKKSSFAIILSCVLLVAVVVPLVTAAGIDNNFLLSAINNGVTTILNAINSAKNTILNAITDAQGNITANTDADTDALAPRFVDLDGNFTVDAASVFTLDLLPYVHTGDTVYSGHATMLIEGGGATLAVYLQAIMPDGAAVALGKMEIASGDVTLNTDFTGYGLRLYVSNIDPNNAMWIQLQMAAQYTTATTGTLYG